MPRQTRIKRYTSASGDFWVEMQQVTKLEIKSGKGPTFQRTFMIFNWDSRQNTQKLKVYDPNNQDEFVEIPLAAKVTTKSGAGPTYQKWIYTFINEPGQGSRKYRVDEVRSSKDPDGEPITVEVPKSFVVKSGSGPTYQKRTFHLNNNNLPGIRRTVRG